MLRLGRAALAVATILLLTACAGEQTPGDPPPGTAGSTAPPSPTPSAAAPSASPSPSDAGTPTESPDPGGATEAADGWQRLADAPIALTEVAAASFAGGIWTAGGLDEAGAVVPGVLIYEPTFDIWEQGPPLPGPRHHAALVSDGQRLHVLGGYTGAGMDAPTAEVVTLDQATGQWVEGPPLPEPRAAGAAAWDGGRIIYGGGVGPDGVSDVVWALEEGAWRQIGALSEAREHLAAASDGAGTTWFLGGRSGGLDSNTAAVDLVAGSDVLRVGELPTPRGGVAGLHLPGVGACALGGEGPDGTFAEVECVGDDGSTTALPPLGLARHGLGAVAVEGSAYAVLGGPEPGLHVSPALEVLDGIGDGRPPGS